jgi:hypothetical protein
MNNKFWFPALIVGMYLALTLHNRIAGAIQFMACTTLLVLKIILLIAEKKKK